MQLVSRRGHVFKKSDQLCVSTALIARREHGLARGTNGIRYETLRRHYGKWLRTEGADQLAKLAALASTLTPTKRGRGEVRKMPALRECERGDLNPKRRPKT